MMQFLRKHQKKLFIVIAIMTVASFAFMGGSSDFGRKGSDERPIGKAIDGTSIFEKDSRALAQFLSMGSCDVMRTDLMETGALSLLAETHFEELQVDFQERMQKVRTATFYSHPQASFLNAFQVWSRFAPHMLRHLREVQSQPADVKTFATYAQLYLDQQMFSPDHLRAVLMYDQQNYSWLTPDPTLNDTRSLALFGFHSFEEWFGARFSNLLCKFIFNAAALAQRQGYKVTLSEARSDFMSHCYEAVQLKSMRREVSAQDASEFMRYQLQIAGVDESSAVQLWKKVMLVHRFFQDLEHGVLLDPIPYEQFSTFADAKASVEVYQLPEPLRLKDFWSMLKVQYYLDAVSVKDARRSLADLPREFLSVSEVEKKHPQLVSSRCELEVAKVSQEAALSQLSLRKLWEYETSDAGWELLIGQYPILNKQQSATAQDREKILDECEASLRKKVDLLARASILKEHPEWVQEALGMQTVNKVAVSIRSKGAVAPFDDIEETSLLRQAIQKAEIGETILFTSPGEQTFYQIKVLQKPDQKQIMTLQEALENDWLGKLLDEKLEAALYDARKKDAAAYKNEDGSWKTYREIRDHVGAYVYSDLLKAISEAPLAHDEYAAKRFQAMMAHAKASVEKEKEGSKFLAVCGDVLIDQWRLFKRRQEVKRSDTTELSKAEMFTQKVGSWSSVSAPLGGNVAFFQLLERDVADVKVQDQVAAGQKLIGQDVKRQRIQKLLDEMGAL